MTRNARTARDLAIVLALIGLLALVVAKVDDGHSSASAETVLKGPFYAVDGDTLWVRGERLRLEGIDAPERAQTCADAGGAAWDCGRVARSLMARMTGADGVTCAGKSRDRYHRLLVVCHDGAEDLNARIVRQGLAVSYGGYRREERQARHAKFGIWQGQFEKPKQWRAEHGGERRDPVAGFVADLVSDAVDWLSDQWASLSGAGQAETPAAGKRSVP
ncbi:MAG: thermonuclease family protein [Neorhizobium sp.]|nr:thermonuclease family protein [Neorhizobium sp.]